MENDNASQISGCEILQIQASELLSSFHPQYSVSEEKLPMKHMSQTSKESDSTKIIYAKLKDMETIKHHKLNLKMIPLQAHH